MQRVIAFWWRALALLVISLAFVYLNGIMQLSQILFWVTLVTFMMHLACSGCQKVFDSQSRLVQHEDRCLVLQRQRIESQNALRIARKRPETHFRDGLYVPSAKVARTSSSRVTGESHWLQQVINEVCLTKSLISVF